MEITKKDIWGHKLVLRICQSCGEEKWMRIGSVSCGLSCNGKKGSKVMHETGWERTEEYKKKLSRSAKKFHKEHPDFRASVTPKGENHPAYKPNKMRRNKYKEFTEYLKRLIRTRDSNTCQNCGRKRKQGEREFDVHHIDGNKNNPSQDNLITLCQSCHVRLHRSSDGIL